MIPQINLNLSDQFDGYLISLNCDETLTTEELLRTTWTSTTGFSVLAHAAGIFRRLFIKEEVSLGGHLRI